MNGESCEYLCFTGASDIGTRVDALKNMALQLAQIPDGDEAYRSTLEIFQLINSLEEKIDQLRQVWMAIEWRDSGDWSDEAITQAIQEFNQKTKQGLTDQPSMD